MRPSRRAATPVLAVLVLAGGCGSGEETVEGPPPSAPAALRVSSPAFADGATIPRRFTCSGADVAPPLRWRGVPPGARALAVVVEDPDAPGGTFVHWTVYDLPPSVTGLRAGSAPPAGSEQGKTSFGKPGYRGPCPPAGDPPHRYRFLVYALKARLGLPRDAAPGDVRAAIGGNALARGRLTGRFGRAH